MGPLRELPRCPFCDGSPRLMLSPPHQHHIKCDGCGARTDDGDIRRVFALWNRRSDRAGLIAGLREAAEWHEAEAEKVQPSWPALASIEVPGAEALAIRRDISGHNRWSAMVFRARIAALETEEGK